MFTYYYYLLLLFVFLCFNYLSQCFSSSGRCQIGCINFSRIRKTEPILIQEEFLAVIFCIFFTKYSGPVCPWFVQLIFLLSQALFLAYPGRIPFVLCLNSTCTQLYRVFLSLFMLRLFQCIYYLSDLIQYKYTQ